MDYQPQTETVGALSRAGAVHANPVSGGVQVATVGAFHGAAKWDGHTLPEVHHEAQRPPGAPTARARIRHGRDLPAMEARLASDVRALDPYLANIEPTGDRIDRYDALLFNLVDPSRTNETRPISGVSVAVYHGGAWETVMFRGEFLEPYLTSIAIQAPATDGTGAAVLSRIHFQLRRTSGWKSLRIALRVEGWGVEALQVS